MQGASGDREFVFELVQVFAADDPNPDPNPDLVQVFAADDPNPDPKC